MERGLQAVFVVFVSFGEYALWLIVLTYNTIWLLNRRDCNKPGVRGGHILCLQCVTAVLLLQLCYCNPWFSTEYAFDNHHRKMTAMWEGEIEGKKKGTNRKITALHLFIFMSVTWWYTLYIWQAQQNLHINNTVHTVLSHMCSSSEEEGGLWVRWKGQHTYTHSTDVA